MGRSMRDRTWAFLVLSILILTAIPSDLILPTSSAQITCCDATEIDYYLIGDAEESGKGELSPFSADLTSANEVWVTSSVSQLTEIARWRIPQATAGSYPATTWKLSVDYEVENAAGVQANVSAEVKIGGKSWTGYSNTNPSYTPGQGTVEVDIEIDEEGTIVSSGELIVVVLSVQTLIFNSPDDDAGVRFVWGSEDYPSHLSATLPILMMDWQTAVTNGHSVQIPVILRSGFGSSIWEKSVTEFHINGIPVETVVATSHNDGAQIYLNWEAPLSAEDGVYDVNLSLTVSESQLQPLTGGLSYSLSFGEGSGTGTGIFPADEPLRSGGSQLSVQIEAAVEDGDRIRRTTSIDINGPMATWIRWGLDNIGNESLDSISQWKNIQGSSSTEATRNNHQVNLVEIQALETHLSGRASSLKRFMFDGLMIDSGRLLGVELIEAAAAPTVNINLHDEFGFSDSEITITIESLENIKLGEKRALFDNFIRPQTASTPYWTDLTIEAHLTTSLMVGPAGVEGSGVSYSHNRFIVSESITVNSITLDGEQEMSDFRVAFVIGDVTHSPLLTLLESFAIVFIFTMFSRRLTKNKSRGAFWLTTALYSIVWAYSYFFAIPLFFMLALLTVAGFMMGAVAIVTPKISLEDSLADEAAAMSLIPSRGRRTKANIIECPVCAEPIVIPSKKSTIRIECDVCETRLKIS